MPGFLKKTPVTDAERRAHDRHDWRTVVSVLLVLLAFAYLFTHAGAKLGLPAPGAVAATFGAEDELIFDHEDGDVVDSSLRFTFAGQMDEEDALMVFLGILAAAFLAAYFLPLPFKQPALLTGALISLALIYGVRGTTGLLFAHVVAYVVFHPVRRNLYFVLLAALATFAFLGPQWTMAGRLVWFAGLTIVFAAAYRLLLAPLLARPRLGRWVQLVTAHSALITITLLALFEWRSGLAVVLPLGILLFFWHWARLIMYHIDLQDGAVPDDVTLPRYLAVFFSPGGIPNWDWGVELGLGYAYTTSSFLREDKNETVRSGVRMLWLAMGYLMLGDWARSLLLDLFSNVGIQVHGGYIVEMVDHFVAGGEVSTITVLMNSLLDTLRWTLRLIGIVHFKVGVWRICGYAFQPYFSKPWLSTNLVVFWSRYTYYYREFLLQAFYYPVFLRFFKKHARTRMVVATIAAAGVGNLIWGHVTERMYFWGMTAEQFGYILKTWPYYLFLSGGIALTALYLLQFSKRKRRRPWTRGWHLITDVLASYGTMQYFSLIHIMSRPSSGSNEWDLFRLMMRGFGIYL